MIDDCKELPVRTMKAWHCDDTRPIPGLLPADVAPPELGPGEVLVRIHAAGVTPTELAWYPTTHNKSGEDRQRAIPGHEFSGIVAAASADVDLAVGQAVFGMNDWFADGATAEYCCAPALAVAPKPVGLTHLEAASIPIGALTAWQGLFDRAGLKAGERVLIHGGAGSVGVLAIQLARWRGAEVVTSASARDREFLVQLGAQQVIDYRSERFEDLASEIDVVFDAVGGVTLQRSWAVLRSGGRLVTIAASSEATDDERTKQAFFIVEPNRQQLEEITALMDSGTIKPVVDAVVPFDQAGSAYARTTATGHGHGKTVVSVMPTNR